MKPKLPRLLVYSLAALATLAIVFGVRGLAYAEDGGGATPDPSVNPWAALALACVVLPGILDTWLATKVKNALLLGFLTTAVGSMIGSIAGLCTKFAAGLPWAVFGHAALVGSFAGLIVALVNWWRGGKPSGDASGSSDTRAQGPASRSTLNSGAPPEALQRSRLVRAALGAATLLGMVVAALTAIACGPNAPPVNIPKTAGDTIVLGGDICRLAEDFGWVPTSGTVNVICTDLGAPPPQQADAGAAPAVPALRSSTPQHYRIPATWWYAAKTLPAPAPSPPAAPSVPAAPASSAVPTPAFPPDAGASPDAGSDAGSRAARRPAKS